MITENRISSVDGGIAWYLAVNVDYCIREDLNINRIEDIWVDAQDLFKGVMCKQPYWSQRQFEQVLHTNYISKSMCLILGYFNINPLYWKNTLIWFSQMILIPRYSKKHA